MAAACRSNRSRARHARDVRVSRGRRARGRGCMPRGAGRSCMTTEWTRHARREPATCGWPSVAPVRSRPGDVVALSGRPRRRQDHAGARADPALAGDPAPRCRARPSRWSSLRDAALSDRALRSLPPRHRRTSSRARLRRGSRRAALVLVEWPERAGDRLPASRSTSSSSSSRRAATTVARASSPGTAASQRRRALASRCATF